MKKATILTLIGVALFAALLVGAKVARQAIEAKSVEQAAQNRIQKEPADKIEVVHFHPTKQCWSCTTVGKYALKTIQERLPDEYASGRVVFREVNLELPENREIARKFRASGSSLYVNAIRKGADDIEEEVTVWRLVYNEAGYLDYFQEKINYLLGK